MEPNVEAPIVIPLVVTVNADKPIAAPDVCMTIDEAVVGLHTATRLGMLLAPASTVGVTSEAKKAEGKLRVIESPEGISAVGVKANVTETDIRPAMRSDDAILNETEVTAS